MTQQAFSPRLRPVIRVFVSSTFSDMKHERNALEAEAFPKLEQLCQRNGFQFQAIDLRWGVSTEAGLDHRTMRICFDELRRAQEISRKPNFLILLGNRYGWRPLPEEISVEEFHALKNAAAQIPGSADKSAVAVLREWYREDTNAIPPVYLLQSRRQDLGDGQDYMHDAVWNQVQAVLWTIINRTMPPEQLQRRFDVVAPDGYPPAIIRFQASATEQEIWHGALLVPDARDHVLAFFREIENLAAFSDPKQIQDFVDVDPSGSVEVALQTEQDRLKAELRQRLGSANVFRNETPARLVEAQDSQGGRTADVTTGHMAQLCADVVSRLSEIIQGQIEEYWRNTAQASMDRAARELEIEQREYEWFAKERGGEESFVGRQVELQVILDYVRSNSRWPLVIHGASGCGKTALLARASQEVAKTRKRIERFIGVTPRSSDLRSLLSSLCQELRQRNQRADALPTEIKELHDEFSQHLQAATPEQPLILFLDALNQLADGDNGRLLNWLPLGSLPVHVKLVVSCLSDRATVDPAGQPYAELKRRQIPAENFINLDALSEAEASLLLFDRWLPKAGRKVSDNQRSRIEQTLASPACRQPIFLKLLFEEVQLWHSYDPATVPGESVPVLLAQLFDRLCQPTNHDPLLVNRVLGYLSASRYGLAEKEILEILFADPEYRAKLDEATEQTRHELPPNAKRIPIALWSRLRFDLAHYLTERAAPGDNVLTFYHLQVAEWVQDHLCTPHNQSWHPHARLAAYFRDIADPDQDKSWKCESGRPFLELSFHLFHSDRKRLSRLLCDLLFLDARCRLGQVIELREDYRNILQALPGWQKLPANQVVRDFAEAFNYELHHIRYAPRVAFQQMYNRLQWRNYWTKLTAEKSRQSYERAGKKYIHQARKPDSEKSHLAFNLTTHVGGALTCAWSPDGKRIASGSVHDGLIVWDAESGQQFPGFHKNISNYLGEVVTSGVWTCAWTYDGRRIATAFHNVEIWDSYSGNEIQSISIDTDDFIFVTACEWLSDNRRVVIGGGCMSVGGIMVCDSENGEVIWKCCDFGRVECIAVSPDSRLILSGGSDSQLRIWDSGTGIEMARFGNYQYGVKDCAWSPDGRYIICATQASELEVWDAYRLCRIRQLGRRGDRNGVNTCAWAPDGKAVVAGYWDGSLHVFNARSWKTMQVLLGHSGKVLSSAWAPDSRRLISSGDDGTVRVWNLQAKTERQTLRGHTDEVVSCKWSPDNQKFVTAGRDELLKVWQRTTGKNLFSADGFNFSPAALAWSFNGAVISYGHEIKIVANNIYMSSRDHYVRLWKAATGKQIGVLETRSSINACSWATDGKRLLSGCFDGQLDVWNGWSGDSIISVVAHNILDICAWSPDGKLVASVGSNDGKHTLKIWDSNTGAEQRTFEKWPSGGPWAIAWSPDGKVIAAVASTLSILEVFSGAEVPDRSKKGGMGGKQICAWSPDGRRIAWLTDYNLFMWDRAVQRSEIVAQGITAFAWSPDGKRLVFGGNTGELFLRNVDKNEDEGVYFTESGISSCAFSGDGGMIAVGDILGGVYLLELRGFATINPVTTGTLVFDPLASTSFLTRITSKQNRQRNITVVCPVCGEKSFLPDLITKTIASINQTSHLLSDDVACLRLPDEAWDNPGFLYNCPKCRNRLRLNPFIVTTC